MEGIVTEAGEKVKRLSLIPIQPSSYLTQRKKEGESVGGAG
jgi:hypothetical protein